METNDKKQKVILVFLLLCCMGAALSVILSALKYGPGTTHDSAAYMYAAQSFLKGEGLQYFGYPSPFIQWPPLYPFLLAMGGLAGISSGAVSIAVNSLAFALTVFFAGRWMLERFVSKAVSAAGILLLTLSVPLLQVSVFLWTEILFVLFFLLAFLLFERFTFEGKFSSLLLAALFSALACLERYAGVTILAAVCLFLLFSRKGPVAGIRNAVLYGALSAMPMGIWVIRNRIVSGTLLGVRLPSEFPLSLNIKRSLNSIYAWLHPDGLLVRHIAPEALTVLKLYTILLPTLIAAVFLVFAANSLIRRKGNRSLSDSRRISSIAFFFVYSLIYAVYLIASATSVAFEPINSRYLVPIYLPMVLGILTAADLLQSRIIRGGTVSKQPKPASLPTAEPAADPAHDPTPDPAPDPTSRLTPGPVWKGTRFAIPLLLALYLVYPLANTAATVLDGLRNGVGGYASAFWRERSGFLKYMNGSGQSAYYSNNADVVYVLSGIRTYSPPKKNGPEMYGLGQFQSAVAGDRESILIWFDTAVPKTLYNLEELSAMYKMEQIGEFGHGKVYRIVK